MINREELLHEMRNAVKGDPSGELLAECIIEKKELGLSQTEAKDLLTVLMHEFQAISPQDSNTETLAESVAGVLDRVVGWCSHDHLYPGGK